MEIRLTLLRSSYTLRVTHPVDPTGRFPLRVSAARPTTADDGGGGGGWLVRVQRGGVTVGGSTSTRRTARGFRRSRGRNYQATRARERDLQRIYRERSYVSRIRVDPFDANGASCIADNNDPESPSSPLSPGWVPLFMRISRVCVRALLSRRKKRKLAAKDPILFFRWSQICPPKDPRIPRDSIDERIHLLGFLHLDPHASSLTREAARSRAPTHAHVTRVLYVCVMLARCGKLSSALSIHSRSPFVRSSRRASV